MWKVALAVLAALGGGGTIVLGLSSFLAKVWAERIVGRELESLRAKNASELESLRAQYSQVQEELRAALARLDFAHRTHYQTEFDALKTIWATMADSRGATLPLRPSDDFGLAEGETLEGRHKERFIAAQSARNKAANALLHLEPFVPPTIAKAAFECLAIVTGELIDCTTTQPEDRFQNRWFEASAKTREKLESATEALADLIRTRLAEASRP